MLNIQGADRQHISCWSPQHSLEICLANTAALIDSSKQSSACVLKVMRETYKTVKGLASIDFANMARQLAADLKVGCCTSLSHLLTHTGRHVDMHAFIMCSTFKHGSNQRCGLSLCGKD